MKKNSLYISLIMLAIVFSAAQLCYAANLLTNPGFEEGNFPPTDWDDWSGSGSENPNDGVAGFPAPPESKHSGSKAVGKILYGTGERWGGLSQTVGVIDGRRFKASGWVKNNKNDGALGKGAKAYIEVKFLYRNKVELKKAKSFNVSKATDWTKLTVRGHVPGKAEKAVFSFVLVGSKGSRGKVLFDDAVLDIGN